jgi:hypothetical protein
MDQDKSVPKCPETRVGGIVQLDNLTRRGIRQKPREALATFEKNHSQESNGGKGA